MWIGNLRHRPTVPGQAEEKWGRQKIVWAWLDLCEMLGFGLLRYVFRFYFQCHRSSCSSDTSTVVNIQESPVSIWCEYCFPIISDCS